MLRLVLGSITSTLLRRLRLGPRRPGWSAVFETVVELLRRDWSELKTWDIPRVRAEMLGKPVPTSASRKVKVERGEWGGIAGLSLTPPSADPGRALLYLHGGSYLFGAPATHLDVASRFALASGLRVVLPDYRLAPEHPYPAALEDALRVYRALLASGLRAADIAVAGESAGGNLTMALALALRDAGEPLPSALAPCSPWLDLAASMPSVQSQQDDYGDREMLLDQARAFAGAIPLDDPRISPMHARLEGLPPTLLQVGTAERLLDETVETHRRALAAGVDARLDLIPEMPHAPHLLAEWCPQGQAAIERASAFLRAPGAAKTAGPAQV